MLPFTILRKSDQESAGGNKNKVWNLAYTDFLKFYFFLKNESQNGTSLGET